jgi:hypothetical protein
LLVVARLEFTSAAVVVQVVLRPMLATQSLHPLQSQLVQVEQAAAETLLEALTAQIQSWTLSLQQAAVEQEYLTEPPAQKLELMEAQAVELEDSGRVLPQVVLAMLEKERMAAQLLLQDLVQVAVELE